jgi:hypothetical protein
VKDDEDLVGDALDHISGWCSREVMWFERALTPDELEEYRRMRAQSSR